MEQPGSKSVKIDPRKLQETAQKKKTITTVAVIVVVIIFFGWVIFFRTNILTKENEPSEGASDLKESFSELKTVFSDFGEDWDEAMRKREQAKKELEESIAKEKINLSDEQAELLKEKAAEKIKEQAEQEDIENWQVYKNEEYGFEIKYPEDWRSADNPHLENARLFLGKDDTGQGSSVREVLFNHKPDELEERIAQIGRDFTDRVEKRENVKFNGIDGLLVTITSKKYEPWYCESLYFTKDDVLFSIATSVTLDKGFEQFYKTFKFIEE